MPCRDWEDVNCSGVTATQKRHDTTARLACEYCRELEQFDRAIPLWAIEWWVEHKRLDAIQLAREKSLEINRKLHKAILDKLTPEERTCLPADYLAKWS